MKKALLFALMTAAFGITACSDENETIINEVTQKGVTLNVTVNGNSCTRALIDKYGTSTWWPFYFDSGDNVSVTHEATTETYTFTSEAGNFEGAEVAPTSTPVKWSAHYPLGAIDLTNQTGELDDVALNYALSGATESATTGASGLNIDLKAQAAVLLISNVDPIDINIKTDDGHWVKGLTAGDFELITSTTKETVLSKTEAGTYYVVVPAGVQLCIKDGTQVLKTTKPEGLEAGYYYKVGVGVAFWEEKLTKGRLSAPYATSISIETDVTGAKPADAVDMNQEGNLWEVLDGSTLRIQTPCRKIYGHDSFTDNYYTNGLFQSYSEVTTITGLENLDMTEVAGMAWMFKGCNKLTSLDLTSFKPKYLANMAHMFEDCQSLTTLDLTGIDTQYVGSMLQTFYDCYALTSIQGLDGFDTGEVYSMYRMFAGCMALTSVDVSHFNTENVMDMEEMFYSCKALTTIDVSSFDTKNVESMLMMFANCQNLTTISLDNTKFKTDNVTNMEAMFYHCYALTSIDVTGFNTENVTDMAMMFANCQSLTSLNLSSFNTANVTDMTGMFEYCEKMTSLTLSSNFTTANVPDMSYMFAACNELTNLDLSSFNTANVTNFRDMFNGCGKLAALKLSNNFVIGSDATTTFMFDGCGNSTAEGLKISNVTDDAIKIACKGDASVEETRTCWDDSHMAFI